MTWGTNGPFKKVSLLVVLVYKCGDQNVYKCKNDAFLGEGAEWCCWR